MDIQGQIGELTFTIEVKRKDTGKVDTFELVGKVINTEENDNGSDPQHSSTERGD